MTFLAETTQDAHDVYYIKGALPKIKKMLNGNIPKQDFSALGSQVHNTGICTYPFPDK